MVKYLTIHQLPFNQIKLLSFKLFVRLRRIRGIRVQRIGEDFLTILNEEHELHEWPNITNETKIIYKDLSFKIMEAIFEVHNTLGPGYSENIYNDLLFVSFVYSWYSCSKINETLKDID